MAGDEAHLGLSKTIIWLQNDSLWLPNPSLAPAPTLHDEELDMQPSKRRRLTANQVQLLEKKFEEENKLEPERKIKLAGELRLLPRQVAIWFQNRRARLKNKQMEKDYVSLRTAFEKLKADYDNLVKKNESLQNEVATLKEKGLGVLSLEPLDAIKSYCPNKPNPKEMCGKVSNVPMVITPKQEEASSAKSDMFDSDSPLSLLEPGSSQAFEPDQSEFSQEEEDNPTRMSLLSSSYFSSSCNFDFPVEDQPFWSWTY